jgi:hypothetical protein
MSSRKLSETLDSVFSEDRDKTTIGSIVDELEQHGMAIVLILFAIPSALPIPAAGYSTLLSLPLLAIGASFLMGRETIWFPEKIRLKEFDPGSFKSAKKWMMKIARIVELFSKPRLKWLSSTRTAQIFLGVLICALAAFMAIPIPGTNTAPAGGIFLIGFGLLEEDGLFVGAGILYSIAAVALASVIVVYVTIYGIEGYEMVKEYIKSLI